MGMMGADLSLLPLREVCARVGLSAATVYRMVAAGTFPAQYRVQGAVPVAVR